MKYFPIIFVALLAFLLVGLTVGCEKEKTIAGPAVYDTTTVIDTLNIVDTVTVTQYEASAWLAFQMTQNFLDSEAFTPDDLTEYMSLVSLSKLATDEYNYGVTDNGDRSWTVYGIVYSHAAQGYYEYAFNAVYDGIGDPNEFSSWSFNDDGLSLSSSTGLRPSAFKR